jgi:hypothetical protein
MSYGPATSTSPAHLLLVGLDFIAKARPDRMNPTEPLDLAQGHPVPVEG